MTKGDFPETERELACVLFSRLYMEELANGGFVCVFAKLSISYSAAGRNE